MRQTAVDSKGSIRDGAATPNVTAAISTSGRQSLMAWCKNGATRKAQKMRESTLIRRDWHKATTIDQIWEMDLKSSEMTDPAHGTYQPQRRLFTTVSLQQMK
ncbi:hypothetical protein [Methanogenium organophilum]|uniref:Uncharacterized protein n=1 Tax=Methanogenium organophilum TaxID=2199 RepID=A0A9X9T8L7_METOG|nr:hypothetical protein [Methanogenium organophilum]WAI02289.1 hypothetical protein OU421_05300 [Methanogenium organophilum]